MNRKWMGLMGLVLGSISCSVEPETIQAGAAARSLGIGRYEIERILDQRIIHLVSVNGSAIGDIELVPIKVGEVGLDNEIITADSLTRDQIIRVRYQNGQMDQEVGKFRGEPRSGVEDPTNVPHPQLFVSGEWQAAVTDPALAPFLKEIELTVVPMELENYVQAGEIAFDGYHGPTPSGYSTVHVGDCDSHRVVQHPSGYPYNSCAYDGGDQYIYNVYYPPANAPLYCNAYRICSPSCCNTSMDGTCSHPKPSGMSQSCSGYGGNGCKPMSEDCGCSGSGPGEFCNQDTDCCCGYCATYLSVPRCDCGF